jgi:hypothetical protein
LPPNLILHACPLGPASLSSLTPSRLRSLLWPHFPPPAGERGATPAARCCYYDLPDVEVRCALLNKLGNGLLGRHDGSALRMISKANGSADALVTLSPAFVITSTWTHLASPPPAGVKRRGGRLRRWSCTSTSGRR